MTAAAPTVQTWRDLEARQQPDWPDLAELAAVKARLADLPPLVSPRAADALRVRLGEAAQGRAFLLQGGDCAETFAGITAAEIEGRVKTLLQMAIILTYGASVPVVKMGRMAGQFGKPRSKPTETRDGVELPSYRGDAVNGYEFTAESRRPAPGRLLQAYEAAAATISFVDAYTRGGAAALTQVHAWNQGFAENPANARYDQMAHEIDRAVSFLQACGAGGEDLQHVDFAMGHEGLLLDYERPLTRIDPRTSALYDTSAHFVWVGERTRQLDGAHIDFFSRIRNPIGVKLGPGTTPQEALDLIAALDPDHVPGRLTFITRMGAGKIRSVLPPILEAVRDSGATPLWITDPMHGNGFTASNGYKTRRFDDVMDEVRGFFEAHAAAGTYPGGIHVEMTGDDVTECLGGAEHIDESDLADRYESLCDPRLNHQQSLELAFQVSELLAENREGK
jgi:3-deoxy-7-phosphoheptulonate synthase